MVQRQSSFEQMKKVFIECQDSSASHGKLLKEMLQIYRKEPIEEFTQHFTKLLVHALVIGDKQPGVDRTLDYCVKFATCIEPGEPDDTSEEIEYTNVFFIGLLEFLIKHSYAPSQAVRFRVCQMIQKLLNELREDATLAEDLFTKIYDCMLERLRDRVAGIRVQAVFALQRLQEPSNKECPVIRAFVHHLKKDPNADVRRAILMNIASCVITLPHILDRCRDINESVRKQAYILIADKISIKSLSIFQRQKLLNRGLQDRSDSIRKIVGKRLLTAWLNRAQTVINFLRMLDVDSSQKTIDLALQDIFSIKSVDELIKELPLSEELLVEKEKLSSQVAVYWKNLAKYFHSKQKDEYLERIFPELTAYADYVKSFILEPPQAPILQGVEATSAIQYEFICDQLIEMIDIFDKSDESGRRHLIKTIRDLLLHEGVNSRVARPLVRCYWGLETGCDKKTTDLLEIVADIREPLEGEERRDPETLSKCLEIIGEILRFPQIKSLSPGIQSFFDMFILQCVSHSDPEVRHAAIQDMGIYCTLSEQLAQDHSSMMIEFARVDPFPVIRLTAIKILFDLVCLYGVNLFNCDADNEESMNTLPSLTDSKKTPDISEFLISLLENESSDMQKIVIEGLCKVLLAGRMRSPVLLSRLLLQWYHPLTSGEEAGHILGVFFMTFPTISKSNQELFAEAFKPALNTIVNAPIHSPLATVDLDEIVKKVVLFTSNSILVKDDTEGDTNVHDGLTLAFCQEILHDVDSLLSRILIKHLNSLQPALPSRSCIQDMRSLVRQILQNLANRASIKLVEKFDKKLEDREKVLALEKADSELLSTPLGIDRANSTTNSTATNSSQSRRQLASRHQLFFGIDADEEMDTETEFSSEPAVTNPGVILQGIPPLNCEKETTMDQEDSIHENEVSADGTENEEEEEIYPSTPAVKKEMAKPKLNLSDVKLAQQPRRSPRLAGCRLTLSRQEAGLCTNEEEAQQMSQNSNSDHVIFESDSSDVIPASPDATFRRSLLLNRSSAVVSKFSRSK
ncbi:condensin complex subunit 3-like isoform X2 [Artemia franciscana]|uniref:condensin complex subunit 3-like isoform X2 n=1 Tax=Artemia franciscana TaxID=6661 RepID=UPI0032DB92CB